MNVEQNTAELNLDAWSDGQMKSKLWLCQELENNWSKMFSPTIHAHIWIYGAWYGTLAQFLLIRDRVPIRQIELFDIDEVAVAVARKMTTMWWLNKKVSFDFHSGDCRLIATDKISQAKPDLLINTSCEHFVDYDWFTNLPRGQKFLLQSTNMKHPTHILCPENLDDFKTKLGEVNKIYYEGVLPFVYPNFQFDRFMVIGEK